MSRALAAGMTDYSHQSLDAILEDLSNWSIALKEITTYLKNNKQVLVENGYWENANSDFKWIFARAYLFYETAIKEIDEIRKEIPIEVQSHHISRLNRLGETSYELNMEWGNVWHQDVKPKQYGTPNFIILENLYAHGRDMAVDLMDLSNVTDRLKDYIGRKGKLDQPPTNGKSINVNIGRDFSGNLVVGDDNETKNES